MKKNFSIIVSVVCCIMLVFCVVQINNLQKEVNLLKHQLDGNYNSLYTTAIDSRVYFENQMQEQLMKQNALFDNIRTDVQYYDDKVKLTISATPKELKNTESVWASVNVNGQVIQQPFDSNNQAVLYFEPIHSVTPVLQVKSDNGVKQQTLEEVQVVKSMATRIFGEWNHNIIAKTGNHALTAADIIIEPSQYFNRQTGLIPFSIEDVVDAHCIVQKTDEPGRRGEGYIESPVTLPDGERLDVSLVSANGAKEIIYRADFSDYRELKDDIHYAVHFVLTLSNGLTYCTEGSSILEFSYGNSGSPFSGGSADFVPVFNEK